MNSQVDWRDELDWGKGDGLIPAVVQDADTGAVLMLAYMNAESLAQTLSEGEVVFFSRSRQRLWRKGETSGNVLRLVDVRPDCDADTLLVRARPTGPVCHLGTTTCFEGEGEPAQGRGIGFLMRLQDVIGERIREAPEDSYTAKLHREGTVRIAQKVGEEGVEVALAAASGDDAELIGESADLLYHVLLLLKSRRLSLEQVALELETRHRP